MNAENTTAICSLIATLITFLGLVWLAATKSSQLADLRERLAKIEANTDRIPQVEARVETLWMKHLSTWEYLRDRGETEVISRDLAKRKSPLAIDDVPRRDDILAVYEPLLPEIEQVVKESGGDLMKEPDDVLCFEAVGTRLGQRLIQMVCPALGVNQGGCVSLALAVLRHKRKLLSPAPIVHIAVIEDDEAFTTLLKSTLRGLSDDLHTFYNWTGADESVEAADIVWIDLRLMPDFGEEQSIARIEALRKKRPGLVIIVGSGYVSPLVRAKLDKAGIDGVFFKNHQFAAREVGILIVASVMRASLRGAEAHRELLERVLAWNSLRYPASQAVVAQECPIQIPPPSGTA